MKCSVCGKEIESTFLNKIKGNYTKTNGKLESICSECFRERMRNNESKTA